MRKNLIKIETIRKTKELKVIFLALCQPILDGIADAQSKYEQACFSGFSEEELVQYAYLSEKQKQNMQNILSQQELKSMTLTEKLS